MTEPTSTVDPHHHPKGPNFLLIVVLFGIAIVLIFIASYIFLLGGGKHVVPGKHAPHPTSRLVLPAAKGTSITALGAVELHSLLSNKNFRPVSKLLRA
jgi:hypothetical protein